MSDDFKPIDDGCLDWDSVIEDDGQQFIVLPEGDYNFEITNFERGHFSGGPKIPACNKAMITMKVQTKDGTANVRKDIFLHSSVEWLISAFFRSIGKKQHGERLSMDWNNVIGKKGRAHFRPRTYKAQSGEERQANDLAYFYDYDDKYFNNDDDLSSDGSDDEELPF